MNEPREPAQDATDRGTTSRVSAAESIEATLDAARPRAIAALLRALGDLDAAEDAFQEACLRAWRTWPRDGVPSAPIGWLIRTGRNAGIDAVRRARPVAALTDAHETAADVRRSVGADDDAIDHAPFRDDVLRLLFVCCHPELAPAQQIALALRVVSGLTVAEIASAFLVADSAMEQRITRAKRRLADAGATLETPGAAERATRIAAVAATIYLLFNEGYSASGGDEHVRVGLCDEAVRLAELLASLCPVDPEVLGLAALLQLQHSRTPARLDGDGAIVLLERQDRSLWRRDRIDAGLRRLDDALAHRRPGPYQIQAAIAATHARAPRADATDWAEIDRLYAALATVQPSPIVSLNHAVAVAKVRGPAAALAMLEPLANALDDRFHFHGLRGALLADLRRDDAAIAAFARALDLARTPQESAHIRLRLAEVGGTKPAGDPDDDDERCSTRS